MHQTVYMLLLSPLVELQLHENKQLFYFWHCRCSISLSSVTCPQVIEQSNASMTTSDFYNAVIVPRSLSMCVCVRARINSVLDITLCPPLCSQSTSQHNHIPLQTGKRGQKKQRKRWERDRWNSAQKEDKLTWLYFHYIDSKRISIIQRISKSFHNNNQNNSFTLFFTNILTIPYQAWPVLGP